jgi:serine phosphatase RsbU (regulator of sigma subunit)
LEEGDVLYTFSDGLADQFGGPRGKKFKYNQLKELIVKLKDNTLTEQQSFIKTYFADWKGNLEQVDDVCLIGVKI